jgi:hypothetical protein
MGDSNEEFRRVADLIDRKIIVDPIRFCMNRSYCYQWNLLSLLLEIFYSYDKQDLFHRANERLLDIFENATFAYVLDAKLKRDVDFVYRERTSMMGLDLKLSESQIKRLPPFLAENILSSRRAENLLSSSRATTSYVDVSQEASTRPQQYTALAIVVAAAEHHSDVLRIANNAPYRGNRPILASVGGFFGWAPDPYGVQFAKDNNVICAVAQNELHTIRSLIDGSCSVDLNGLHFLCSSIPIRLPARLTNIVRYYCTRGNTLFFSYLGSNALTRCKRIPELSEFVGPERQGENLFDSSCQQLIANMQKADHWSRNDPSFPPVNCIVILAYAGWNESTGLAQWLWQNAFFRDFTANRLVVLAMGNREYSFDDRQRRYNVGNILVVQPGPFNLKGSGSGILIRPDGGISCARNDGSIDMLY